MAGRTRRSALQRALVAVIALAVSAAGCGGDPAGDPPTPAAPVVLRLGTDDTPGRPAAEQIEHLVREVDELSGGALRIEPVWEAAGEDVDDWDQAVARMVADGELDMAMVPARAWDTEGVTSMRALHAPFLVTSNELLGRVASSELPTDMLAGLEEVGVTGLALVPEGVRYLFVFGQPPATLNGFARRLVRAPRSATTYAAIEALGATPVDFDGNPAAEDAALTDGSLLAAESSFALAPGLAAPTTALGDLPLFPKANSLVIHTGSLGDLSDEHQVVLREAAARTVDHAINELPDDAEAAQAHCADGGRVVEVGPAMVDAARQATQVVYEELEREPITREQLVALRTMRTEVGEPGASLTCEPTSAGSDAAMLEGAWRTAVLDVDDMIATLRAQGLDEWIDQFREVAPVGEAPTMLVLEIRDGRWDLYGEVGDGETDGIDTEARVRVDGDELVVSHDVDHNVFEWAIEGDTLRLTWLSTTYGDSEGVPEEVFQRALYMTSRFTREG